MREAKMSLICRLINSMGMEFVMKEMFYFRTGDCVVPELQIEMRYTMFSD